MAKRKKLYTSKTLWINVIGIAAIIIQQYTSYVVSPDVQVGMLGVINFALRLITKEPITLKD